MKVEVHCRNGKIYSGALHHTDTSHIFVRVENRDDFLALHWDWVVKAYRVTKDGKRPMSIKRYQKRG